MAVGIDPDGALRERTKASGCPSVLQNENASETSIISYLCNLVEEGQTEKTRPLFQVAFANLIASTLDS